MKKPIIGIVSKHYEKEYRYRNTYIRDEVKQAIFDNGGIAIGILPPNTEKIKAKNLWKNNLTKKEFENLKNEINLCDGIILQGGDFSDEYEGMIAKYCYEENIPLLGICAGLNNIVRGLGGKIKKLDNIETHKSSSKYVHEINIEPTSKFYEIVQISKMKVNSRHKCYTNSLKKLSPVAYSNDKIIEVVEDKSKTFFMGLQFHPESLYKEDKCMNKIFISFISSCK